VARPDGVTSAPHRRVEFCYTDVSTSREKTRQAAPRRMCFRTHVGEWLSLVEHLVRDQGVGGSNPLSPTISKRSDPET
jgi:hypothetical protein